MKFKADFNGQITGIRFYKSGGNLGTHTGSLWAATGGSPLATATFTNETASGWQTATFSSPGERHRGHHVRRVVLRAAGPLLGRRAAVWRRRSTTARSTRSRTRRRPTASMPTVRRARSRTAPTGARTTGSTCSTRSRPGAVATPTAEAAGPTAAKVTWTAPASGGPVESYRITPYAGTTALTAPVTAARTATSKVVTGLTTGTAYRFTVQAVNANGAGAASAQSNAVTPAAAVAPDPPTGVVGQAGVVVGAGELDGTCARR